jgi:glycosyltransferase involved in cell wall biosynthesis
MTIDLVFVTYNRLDYTQKALTSILADPTEEFRLTIWDNASKDGTVEYLRGEVRDPRISDIILSKENKGQIAAVNEVWSRSKADLLGKLDNDCMVTPGWTRTLGQAHADIDALGVVACWHYFPDDFDEARARHKIQTFGRHRIFRHPWTCGTGLLIKNRDYRKFGPIQSNATTQYWMKMALAGRVNGFYYPLVLQEHMDDPKSVHSHLKDEESYQKAKEITFSLKLHGQHTLNDRWRRRQEILDNLLDETWNPVHYIGWKRKVLYYLQRPFRNLTVGTTEGIAGVGVSGASAARKPCYRTQTRVTQTAAGRTVIKSPETDEAKPFVAGLADREALAASFFADRATVVRGRLVDGAMHYEYLDVPSLEDLIAQGMTSQTDPMGLSQVEKYVEFVRGLPGSNAVPREFLRGLGQARQEGPAVRCLNLCVPDCIPRNIKAHSRQWMIIDNEWTFDYPMPVDFLVFRGLYSLVVGLQPLIQQSISAESPGILFMGYGRRRHYIPCSWYSILKTSEIGIATLTRWESLFQTQVLTEERRIRLRLSGNPKALTSVSRSEPGSASNTAISRLYRKIAAPFIP